MLFMGQEYAESADFLYFTDHGDPALIEAVREGRRKEFEAFSVAGKYADPQDATTFDSSKVNWNLRHEAPHSGVLAWHRDWIAMRKQHAALHNCRKSMVRAECDAQSQWLVVERRDLSGSRALLVCNFSDDMQEVPVPFRSVPWSLCLWSGATRYGRSSAGPVPQILENQPFIARLAGPSAALYVASS
jgi:maltooligosyltrehalose trehalohydrolase